MNSIARQLQEEIRQNGPISLARFMEVALYAPGLGYYERQHEIGRRGDFLTSVSVGAVFGELLAFQFAKWWDEQPTAELLQITEAGAHDGTLACDILDWFQGSRPDLFERLHYCIIEPSAVHRDWQTAKLNRWLSKIRWVKSIESGPQIIFGNEFLDAMPAHRLSWNAGERKWLECFVNNQFIWEIASPSIKVPTVPEELAAILPDGFIIEVSPLASAWWKHAGGMLTSGKILTIDYGLTREERFLPQRHGGTLRAFAAHHLVNDPLAHPGEQDLTAHVDFSAIEEAGQSAGLRTEVFASQEKFLTQVIASGFALSDAARIKQFRTLTHPEHLGRSFRVLVQSRPQSSPSSGHSGRGQGENQK